VVVIGAGTAGLVTAAGTASLGGRVALIERNKMGGDCLNFGCVPSKALISSARLAQQMREAEKWGLHNQEPQFEFREVMERMRARRRCPSTSTSCGDTNRASPRKTSTPNDSKRSCESCGAIFARRARIRSITSRNSNCGSWLCSPHFSASRIR